MGQDQRRAITMDLVVDLDPVTIDLRHGASPAACCSFGPGRILASSVYGCEPRRHRPASSPPHGPLFRRADFATGLLPQRKTCSSEIYSLQPFPNWIASNREGGHAARQLALTRWATSYPTKSELPPVAGACHRQGKKRCQT